MEKADRFDEKAKSLSLRQGGDLTMSPKVEYDPLKFYEDPYPIYRELRETAPVYYNEERDLWVLSRYSDVQAAARDYKTFVSGHGVDVDREDFSFGPGDFLDMDPPRHDELRRILNDAFTPAALKVLEPEIAIRANQLLDPLIEKGYGDFAREYAHRLPFSMIMKLWGVPERDHQMLEDWFTRMIDRVPGEPIQNDVWVAGEEMRVYIDEAVPRTSQQTPA